MSEERKQPHPEEAAEGAEDLDVPGAQKPEGGPGEKDEPDEGRRSGAHPREPAEGGGDEVEAGGAEKKSDN
ncbi:Hypothetical Protein RradSPS_1703 [Rubrobacter radiotolerans]|uniref:Uncharacterized protein n=1 Tax=Rubrobacter radiotolerans TaxID=42256 RepID=A0A023X461_RUBRA|nr:hypothetical protein [Rubrobacter radiotolerans]AHY46986.1 Hypothetical Protein RradSPS_1703 [Rubrobacter radiotolerans]MDX5894392.1 hypothetical protein [Rubrobacter radiotolerans]SMC05893.1 retinitis pigmentosa GTPase regulator [Rubrobacter radiotolerans DSM 5868]